MIQMKSKKSANKSLRQRGMALSSYAKATEDRSVPLRGLRWLVPRA